MRDSPSIVPLRGLQKLYQIIFSGAIFIVETITEFCFNVQLKDRFWVCFFLTRKTIKGSLIEAEFHPVKNWSDINSKY